MPIVTGQDILAAEVRTIGRSIYGDGSDGDVVTAGGGAGDVTLARDMYYDDLTITAGDTMTTAGYRIHVQGTLTNNGVIERDGDIGADGTAADAGAGGAALAATTLGASGAGGKGASVVAGANFNGGGGGSGAGLVYIAAKVLDNSGGTIRANGGNGGAGSVPQSTAGASVNAVAGGNTTDSLGDNGGAGGDTAGIGGGAGAGGTATAAIIGVRALPLAALLQLPNGTLMSGGGGGGGGDRTTVAHGEAQGDGGGGGGGGCIVLVYNVLTAGTEQVNGGTGGAGHTNGVNGTNGTVIKIPNQEGA